MVFRGGGCRWWRGAAGFPDFQGAAGDLKTGRAGNIAAQGTLREAVAFEGQNEGGSSRVEDIALGPFLEKGGGVEAVNLQVQGGFENHVPGVALEVGQEAAAIELRSFMPGGQKTATGGKVGLPVFPDQVSFFEEMEADAGLHVVFAQGGEIDGGVLIARLWRLFLGLAREIAVEIQGGDVQIDFRAPETFAQQHGSRGPHVVQMQDNSLDLHACGAVRHLKGQGAMAQIILGGVGGSGDTQGGQQVAGTDAGEVEASRELPALVAAFFLDFPRALGSACVQGDVACKKGALGRIHVEIRSEGQGQAAIIRGGGHGQGGGPGEFSLTDLDGALAHRGHGPGIGLDFPQGGRPRSREGGGQVIGASGLGGSVVMALEVDSGLDPGQGDVIGLASGFQLPVHLGFQAAGQGGQHGRSGIPGAFGGKAQGAGSGQKTVCQHPGLGAGQGRVDGQAVGAGRQGGLQAAGQLAAEKIPAKGGHLGLALAVMSLEGQVFCLESGNGGLADGKPASQGGQDGQAVLPGRSLGCAVFIGSQGGGQGGDAIRFQGLQVQAELHGRLRLVFHGHGAADHIRPQAGLKAGEIDPVPDPLPARHEIENGLAGQVRRGGPGRGGRLRLTQNPGGGKGIRRGHQQVSRGMGGVGRPGKHQGGGPRGAVVPPGGGFHDFGFGGHVQGLATNLAAHIRRENPSRREGGNRIQAELAVLRCRGHGGLGQGHPGHGHVPGAEGDPAQGVFQKGQGQGPAVFAASHGNAVQVQAIGLEGGRQAGMFAELVVGAASQGGVLQAKGQAGQAEPLGVGGKFGCKRQMVQGPGRARGQKPFGEIQDGAPSFSGSGVRRAGGILPGVRGQGRQFRGHPQGTVEVGAQGQGGRGLEVLHESGQLRASGQFRIGCGGCEVADGQASGGRIEVHGGPQGHTPGLLAARGGKTFIAGYSQGGLHQGALHGQARPPGVESGRALGMDLGLHGRLQAGDVERQVKVETFAAPGGQGEVAQGPGKAPPAVLVMHHGILDADAAGQGNHLPARGGIGLLWAVPVLRSDEGRLRPGGGAE